MSMKVDSLQELRYAFAEWRRGKKYAREPMPDDLRARAQRATKKHGVSVVARATRIDARRLFQTGPARAKAAHTGAPRAKRRPVRGAHPTFSQLTLSAPSAASPQPIAEVERSGVTLRVFEQTPELMELLSVASGLGATR
jgi:hypothetical protein